MQLTTFPLALGPILVLALLSVVNINFVLPGRLP